MRDVGQITSEDFTGLEDPPPVAHSCGFWPQFLLAVGRRPQLLIPGPLTKAASLGQHGFWLPPKQVISERETERDAPRWNHIT